MKHLWEMTLDELLNPQGHACSCGRVHRCGLKMLRVGKGAVDALPEALAATQVQRPFVVADAHTYQAAGQKVDITDELEETGSFRRTFTLEEPQSDGTSIEHSCTVTVTGSLASWTAIWDYGGGVTYTAAGGRG